MINIHIVEYQCSDCSELVVFPVRAFISKQKAENFITECKKECERIDLELEEYWGKHRIEYYGVEEVIRRHARKYLNVNTKMKEFKRKLEIEAGELKIIASHKHHKDCRRKKDGNYYDITTIEMDKSE